MKILITLFILQFSLQAKSIWVYLDLGNTIIDTRVKGDFKYFKKSQIFLNDLVSNGFSVGAITNIPESFGDSHEAKLKTLKTYIQENWKDGSFSWNSFKTIFLPLHNGELKPSEVLYLRALENAKNCPSIYISENLKEVEKAKSLGMAAYLFDFQEKQDYPEIDSLEDYILSEYQREYSKECLNN